MENIKDPLYRYFEREVNSGARLLRDVIHDLEDVAAICQVPENILTPSAFCLILLIGLIRKSFGKKETLGHVWIF